MKLRWLALILPFNLALAAVWYGIGYGLGHESPLALAISSVSGSLIFCAGWEAGARNQRGQQP